MADRKISELTNLTGANLADDDEFPLVDTSADETKAITFGEFKTALDTATGFVRITGDTMTGNLSMGDNVKAIFGAGPELQIYSDGTSGIIKDVGSGDIKILADDFYVQNAAGSSTLISVLDTGKVGLGFAGSEKLATESGGVNITGTLTSDGLTVDGNVGIGVTPSAWSTFNALEMSNGVYLGSYTGGTTAGYLGTNNYFNGSNFIYKNSDFAARYQQVDGKHQWFTAPSGTAGNAISFSQAMTLDASGNVGIGTSSNLLSGSNRTTVSINNTGSAAIAFGVNGTREGHIYSDTSALEISSASNPMRFTAGDSERMRLDASGNVGIGTSSPVNVSGVPDLTVAGKFFTSDGTATNPAHSFTGDQNTGIFRPTTDTLAVTTAGSERMRIASDGSVAINDSSPDGKLNVVSTAHNNGSIFDSTGTTQLWLRDTDAASNQKNWGFQVSGGSLNILRANDDRASGFVTPIEIQQAPANSLVINSSGSVGLGVSPAQLLHIASSAPDLRIEDTDGGYADFNVPAGSIELRADQGNTESNSTIKMFVDSTEAMRIDSSGNLLVGKTTQGLTNAGFEVAQSGQASITQSGASALRLNRLSSDGELLQFRKDGSTVGSIGNFFGYMQLGTGDTGLLFDDDNNHIKAWNTSTNGGRDAAVDLGASGTRFKDLYLSGGVFLGGTGAANKLNDYEEGGWTPSFGNTGGVTYDQQSGRYTKIGRAVHIQGVIRWSAFTPSSNVFLGGLPFTPEGSDNFINSVSVFPANGTAYNVAYEYLSGGSLFFYNNSGSLGGSAASNPFGSSGSIIINGIYYA